MSTGVTTRTGYHNRRSYRLKGYDYSRPGFYFITICIHDTTQPLFGEIVNGKMVLNNYGLIARDEWIKTPQIRDNVKIDEYIIMPDHMHGIIQICSNKNNPKSVGAYRHTPSSLHENNRMPINMPLYKNNGAYGDTPLRENIPQKLRSPSNSLGSIIRGFKGAVKISINIARNTPGKTVWQRNYHDHIIRDQRSLFRIRQYIRNNPMKWSDKNAEKHLRKEVDAFNDDDSWTKHYIDYIP